MVLYTKKELYIGTEDEKLLVHSYWSDDVGTKALYNRGKLVWIKPKGQTSLYLRTNRVRTYL